MTSNSFRILSLALSSKGFGYAILEGQDTLVEAAVKTVFGEKNRQSLKKIESLLIHYQPDILILEDVSAPGSRRWPRIRTLNEHILKLAKTRQLKVKLYTRVNVLNAFMPGRQGTKQMLAQLMAQRFPEQLAWQLPPPRKAWMSEDARLALFDAVALALKFIKDREKREAKIK